MKKGLEEHENRNDVFYCRGLKHPLNEIGQR
jgi:hypothetical protein